MEIDLFKMVLVPTFKMLWVFWPLLALGLFLSFVGVLAPVLVERYQSKKRFEAGKNWRSDQELLKWLQAMSPIDFEKYTAELFGRLGYIAQATKATRDGGVDVILEKDGRTSYIQCKKYYTSKVTEPQVREFYGALADKLASGKGFIVTTNIFTIDAERFAKDKPIELIDGLKLVEYIRAAEKKTPQVILTTNKCPKCGSDLIGKNKHGRFLACSAYPKCHYTKSLN